MKKIVTLLLSLLMLCACSNGGNNAADTADKTGLDAIKEKGKITVAVEGTWAPFTYHDENGDLVGFDVEVARYIADHIGVEVEFVEGEWDGLLMGVESGRYDMLVNGCDITDERKEVYDFSDPYAFSKIVVITKADNTDINAMEDLAGKKTANTLTSSYAAIAESYGATNQGVDDFIETIELLKAGRVDATVNDAGTYGDYVNSHGDDGIKVACYYPEVSALGIPMKKGNTELVKAVNEAIAQGLADGTFAALSEKYFGMDVTTAE